MSLSANLAKNLRRMCPQWGDIEVVCREMGMNRTQFEKYLHGKAMPSRRSIEKISAYFGVSEEDLFAREAGVPRAERKPGEQDTLNAQCAEVMRPLWTEGMASLKPGLYFLWISVPKDPDRVVCAPVIIAKKGEALTFRRIVGAGEPRDQLFFHRVGDHKGVVVERLNWIMFMGVNQRGTYEPSMMRLRWTSLSQPTLSGHATITTESGVSFSALCMRPAPAGLSFRKAVRQSRSYHRDDPIIDATVRMVLKRERQDLVATVTSDLAP
jgi:transcriptional regulator with XRE-family HTH domain